MAAHHQELSPAPLGDTLYSAPFQQFIAPLQADDFAYTHLLALRIFHANPCHVRAAVIRVGFILSTVLSICLSTETRHIALPWLFQQAAV